MKPLPRLCWNDRVFSKSLANDPMTEGGRSLVLSTHLIYDFRSEDISIVKSLVGGYVEMCCGSGSSHLEALEDA